MAINRVHNTPELFEIMRQTVEENGIGITFQQCLLEKDGSLRQEKVCILKLDDYFAYNSRHTHNPPQVTDYLVIVQCDDGSVSLYIIELRKSNGRHPTRRLSQNEIRGKFETAILDFICVRHPEIFENRTIRQIKAHLVSDPWRLTGRPDADELFAKKVKLSQLDAYFSMKPIEAMGRRITIDPTLPPNPVIHAC